MISRIRPCADGVRQPVDRSIQRAIARDTGHFHYAASIITARNGRFRAALGSSIRAALASLDGCAKTMIVRKFISIHEAFAGLFPKRCMGTQRLRSHISRALQKESAL